MVLTGLRCFQEWASTLKRAVRAAFKRRSAPFCDAAVLHPKTKYQKKSFLFKGDCEFWYLILQCMHAERAAWYSPTANCAARAREVHVSRWSHCRHRWELPAVAPARPCECPCPALTWRVVLCQGRHPLCVLEDAVSRRCRHPHQLPGQRAQC
eukprot:3653175-Rhodomonas_salina.1